MLVFSRFCKCLFSQQLVLTPSPALAPSNADTRVHRASDYPIAVVIDKEDEEATKSSTSAKSSAANKLSTAIKSSVSVDEQKLAAKPSTTSVVVELTDKEKRATNKKFKEEVLQKMPQFEAVLGVPYVFGTEHWKELLFQMENVGNYTNQLFFGPSRVSQNWRSNTVSKARAKLEIGIIQVNKGGKALGESSSLAARSAIEISKRVTSTHTLRISDDVAANDVAVGQVVSTLEAFRGGVTPIIPSVLTSYFAFGNPSKAQKLVSREYDIVMMNMATSYDYETAKELAAVLLDKHDLSANFPTFTEDSYNNPTQFTSANEIKRMVCFRQIHHRRPTKAFVHCDKKKQTTLETSLEMSPTERSPCHDNFSRVLIMLNCSSTVKE
jgi:hypothetical protein